VVAHGAAVIGQEVHGLDDRVHRAAVEAALIGDVVAHRVALDHVAIVEQQDVLGLGPGGGQHRGGAGQAHRVVALVAVVVIGEDGDMQVRRLQDPQLQLRRRGPQRGGGQADRGGGDARLQGGAAGEVGHAALLRLGRGSLERSR
jgi:hypothetical protein